jgi:Tat protein translocase TatB subunit
MLNIGPGEVLVILVIALVVLGPSRLPATARTMGRILARTRRLVRRFQEEMQAAADAPLEALARERGRLNEPLPSPGRSGSPDPPSTPPAGTSPAEVPPDGDAGEPAEEAREPGPERRDQP